MCCVYVHYGKLTHKSPVSAPAGRKRRSRLFKRLPKHLPHPSKATLPTSGMPSDHAVTAVRTDADRRTADIVRIQPHQFVAGFICKVRAAVAA